MIEILGNLGLGFVHVLAPANVTALLIGLVVGMLVAILPGLTLVMGVVLVLPFTYGMALLPSIIMLTAMYVSGTYGGAFTSILFRIPGEPLDVPLLWDGYTMGRKGAPAKALGWTLYAALWGGLLTATAMVLLAHPFARFALTFDAPEYFSVILFGLTSVVALAGTSMTNALISLFVGLLLSTVGVDEIYGVQRFTFGVPVLADGIKYVTIMVGAYGLGEVLGRLEQGFQSRPVKRSADGIKTELPTLSEVWKVRSAFARSSLIGVLLGIVPGAGATITSFVSYGAERQYGKRKALLGTGIPEGIVAPQIASTASVGGHMVPLLTLGIPGSGATAIILGAFLLHGVQPGPQLFTDPKSAALVYAIFASLFLSVLGMCAMGYFWIRSLVKVMDAPEAVVSAFVVLFCVIGAFSERNNLYDVWMIVIFGIVGYLFDRFRFPIAPLVLGAILGPEAETSFTTSMISHRNDWAGAFFGRPISCVLMILTIAALGFPLIRHVLRLGRAWRAG
ncbi:MAG: tripartite tricarboxylate transporter permease [Betaproteobacteria bacterium]|nr:tripartite tricarboxylate transporter permease [Betaproteobacteria bacterium]